MDHPELHPNLCLIIPSILVVSRGDNSDRLMCSLVRSGNEGLASGGQPNHVEEKSRAQSLCVKKE